MSDTMIFGGAFVLTALVYRKYGSFGMFGTAGLFMAFAVLIALLSGAI